MLGAGIVSALGFTRFNDGMNQETRNCQNCRSKFVIEPEDFDFYKKIEVPPPTWCPECREIRRIAFRNERALYKRKCDLCGNLVVARVSPDKPYPMYCTKCWWGDGWDPLSFGRPYDFTRSFFEQLQELWGVVPHVSLGGSNNVNSEWVNQETDDKNCYLNVGGHLNEDSAYNTYELYGRDSFDNYWLFHGELCYEDVNCERCYRVFFSDNCFDCRNVIFSSDCRNCSNILGCAGLRNKQYHLFNKPVSKEEYEKFLADHPTSSSTVLQDLKKRSATVRLGIPHRERFSLKCIDTEGNYVTESKDSIDIWNAEKIENAKHLFIATEMKDSYDGSCIGWGELCYESGHSSGMYDTKFTLFSFGSNAGSRQASNLEYCMLTSNSNNCFGCMGVRGKEYCILNRQYAKDEYDALLPKIKEHMGAMPYRDKNNRAYGYGEFFPMELSPFGYNETVANEYYPLSQDEAVARGYCWSDYEAESKYAVSDYAIPDDIRTAGEDILEKVLRCEVSGKPYRLIPMELQFYRRIGLPIPRRAPLQRHLDRMNRMLPRRSYERICDCKGSVVGKNEYQNSAPHEHGTGACPRGFKSPYSPDRPEIVYCEACYNAEIA